MPEKHNRIFIIVYIVIFYMSSNIAHDEDLAELATDRQPYL